MTDRLPSKETLESIRKNHPEGTRVELVSMNDPYTALKPGDKGTVSFVDDIGTIFVRWDNGSGLGVAFGADYVKKLEPEREKPSLLGQIEQRKAETDAHQAPGPETELEL
jgi:hypothetical protein